MDPGRPCPHNGPVRVPIWWTSQTLSFHGRFSRVDVMMLVECMCFSSRNTRVQLSRQRDTCATCGAEAKSKRRKKSKEVLGQARTGTRGRREALPLTFISEALTLLALSIASGDIGSHCCLDVLEFKRQNSGFGQQYHGKKKHIHVCRLYDNEVTSSRQEV